MALLPLLFAVSSCSSGSNDSAASDDFACTTGYVFSNPHGLSGFFKGNTHTHTERSYDSYEPVNRVVAWFKNAGYQFVVLTDHDVAADPNTFYSSVIPSSFIVIAGEELSSVGMGPGGNQIPVHVNAICSNGATLPPVTLPTARATLQDSVRRVSGIANAVAQINHPNYDYALNARDILSSNGAQLIEIANQHKDVQNAGDDQHASVEAIWDEVLSSGTTLYGVASDDNHTLPVGSWAPPGKGWVQVAASELSPDAICTALANGDFYASTGVELESVNVSETALRVTISPAANSAPEDYETSFIGRNGSVLATTTGLEANYELVGDPLRYVRARVSGPSGETAWVQPQLLSCKP